MNRALRISMIMLLIAALGACVTPYSRKTELRAAYPGWDDETLRKVSAKIPSDIDWVLRIDGHTDRVPIRSSNFASNWELSTARAVSVVRFLADQGIPEKRMAAAGFSKFHPLDPTDTQEAYHKNRRIEIKLTSR